MNKMVEEAVYTEKMVPTPILEGVATKLEAISEGMVPGYQPFFIQASKAVGAVDIYVVPANKTLFITDIWLTCESGAVLPKQEIYVRLPAVFRIYQIYVPVNSWGHGNIQFKMPVIIETGKTLTCNGDDGYYFVGGFLKDN